MSALLESPHNVRHRSRASNRLLLIAYAFPPVGGAGVQRPLKWVKYLHRSGWNVTVLTPENPSVPVHDQSLLAEIPEDTVFLRPRTWEPEYQLKQKLGNGAAASWSSLPNRAMRRLTRATASLALQPDPQILWYRNAVAAATNHLRKIPHDVVLVTAPPYSSFLIGAALKRRFGLPLVLDYRDEWDLSSRYLEHARRDWFSRGMQTWMQQSVLRLADAVVATTQASVQRLEQHLREIGHCAQTSCIYNGFDAEDFASPDSTAAAGRGNATTEKLRLVYTGTLWNLTTIEPVVAALERLHANFPDLAARIELACVGRKTPEQRAVLSRLNATVAQLVNVDYCDHAAALNWLRSADALCLLLSDVPGAERVTPAKLFEYLATRKEMLAVMPDGEAAGIVRQFHPAGWFTPSDVSGIVRWLHGALERHAAVGLQPCDFDAEIDAFSRERQTERLIELLDDVMTTAAPRGGRQ